MIIATGSRSSSLQQKSTPPPGDFSGVIYTLEPQAWALQLTKDISLLETQFTPARHFTSNLVDLRPCQLAGGPRGLWGTSWIWGWTARALPAGAWGGQGSADEGGGGPCREGPGTSHQDENRQDQITGRKENFQDRVTVGYKAAGTQEGRLVHGPWQ